MLVICTVWTSWGSQRKDQIKYSDHITTAILRDQAQ